MLDEFIKSLSTEQKQALLESINESLGVESLKSEPQKKPKPVRVDKSKATKSKLRDQDLDFTISRTDNEEKTRMPVTETKRFNSFTDDGTEAKDEEFKTPDIQPTERRRPPVQKVNQKCSKCGKQVSVHPTHARDWFTCDRCIGVR